MLVFLLDIYEQGETVGRVINLPREMRVDLSVCNDCDAHGVLRTDRTLLAAFVNCYCRN